MRALQAGTRRSGVAPQKQVAEVAIDSTKTLSVAPPVADGRIPNEQTVVSSRTANDVDLIWVDEVCGKLIRDVRTAAMAAQASNAAAESLASSPIDDQPEPLAVQTAADNRAETPLKSRRHPQNGVRVMVQIFSLQSKISLSQIEESTKLPTIHESANLPFVCPNALPSVVTPSQAAAVSTESDDQLTDIASPSIPWPIFAPEASDSEPETHVAHEIQVPWPVFAPSDATFVQANVCRT